MLKELTKGLLFSLLLINGLMFTVNAAEHLNELIEKKMGLPLFLKCIICLTPYNLILTAPICTLLTVLSLYSQMSFRKEFVAIASSGIRHSFLLFPPLAISLGVSILCLLLNQFPAPQALSEHIRIERGERKREAHLTIKMGDMFVHIERVNGGSISGITIQNPTLQICADRGKYGERGWYLADGIERRIEMGEVKREERFFRKKVDLPKPEDLILLVELTEKDLQILSLRELAISIKLFSEYGIPKRERVLELHHRIAFSFVSFVMALIGIGIVLRGLCLSIYANFGLCLFVCFLYWEGITFMRQLHSVSPLLSAWAANIVGISFGVKMAVWR
jgi:lipopolysaccharide export LptBFGC system permease protein LptF